MTYNSNHIEGSLLTHDQTRDIFETNTIGVKDGVLNVDDIIETSNHFRCIDMIIDSANLALSEKLIKELHLILKSGIKDSKKDCFAVGEYKKLPNEVDRIMTVLPENKESLKNNNDPFIIENESKMFYYRNLKEWNYKRAFLIDTCLSAQD